MLLTPRKFAFLVLAGLSLIATGCGGNESKIIGKWKVVGGTGFDEASKAKDGKDDKSYFYFDFKPDGNVTVGMELDASMKAMLEKSGAKLDMNTTAKYKISGDQLEFIGMDKKGEKGDGPFGKENKAKIKFEGDNLTLSTADGSKTAKLTKVK
ncbi:MAG: hypothetical protein C0467_05575 [Planctomycetaceae bacterium]|nr:hypothetical protein [Planctomycetaceae bacterium]